MCWCAIFLAIGLAGQLGALAAGSFTKELSLTTPPIENLVGVDLAHNFYYASEVTAKGKRKLTKHPLTDLEVPATWSVEYDVPVKEVRRSLTQEYDKDGNIYEFGLVRTDDNTVTFRKFDGATGKLLFTKTMNPCAGYSSDYTRLEVAKTDSDVFGVALTCDWRLRNVRKDEVYVAAFNTAGTMLYALDDMPGSYFCRIRADGDVFVLDTGAITPRGRYNGAWVAHIDAMTGAYLFGPEVFYAGLGGKPESSQATAILTAVAYGLGQSSVEEFTIPTGASAIDYITSVNAQDGETAFYVSGASYGTDGPTHLAAFDQATGKYLTKVAAGRGVPIDMYVRGDRVAVMSYEFDKYRGDQLTVWNYVAATPGRG